MTKTLKKIGTPWAEYYGGSGSGRLTGRLAEEPVYQANGDVAPGWGYVGNLTEAEFYADFEEQEHDQCHTPATADWFEEQEHDQCHTPATADWHCPHCVAAGWVAQ